MNIEVLQKKTVHEWYQSRIRVKKKTKVERGGTASKVKAKISSKVVGSYSQSLRTCFPAAVPRLRVCTGGGLVINMCRIQERPMEDMWERMMASPTER
jgi:hypothetical protein